MSCLWYVLCSFVCPSTHIGSFLYTDKVADLSTFLGAEQRFDLLMPFFKVSGTHT